MKLLLITTTATMPFMGYGMPAEESDTTTVPQIQTQKLQQVEKAKAEKSGISIHRAAWEGNIKAVEQYLAAGKDVNVKDDLYGDTPLLWATGFGHKEVIEMLIAKGANVNSKAEGGWTPLHYATGGNDQEIVRLLIAEGADLNSKNAKDQITPLHWATWRGHEEVVELLIIKGADINAKNKSGGTPLHNAAWKGHKEIIDLLIGKGADVNAKDIDGETPFNWAEEANRKEISQLFRKHGGKSGEELKAEKK
ncbi:MAG: ankyrin repeat domain-containing protein [Verrucomicrobiota bacterium]|nr:ankyrin repeat domain-containing protein [Verrucomicrobiota bacterium]